MKKIAILTSGGDAPGMNAAIRAVVRTGLSREWQVHGVYNGYRGLIDGEIKKLTARSVGGVIQNGGTILHSARCPEFKTEEGRAQALAQLKIHDIEVLVVVGGNGSQTGAHALSQLGFPVVGIASTIDNDLYGSEITIGADSALWVALEAIDRLKVTASSHHRAFIVEVMGRNCGYLALMSGIAGGAEVTIIPEVATDPEEVVERIHAAYKSGKAHALIVVAEGAEYNARGLKEYFDKHRERLGFDVRETILGHMQRGGAPSAFDRILATRFGAKATDCIARGELNVLVGLNKGVITATPLAKAVSTPKKLNIELLELSRMLT